MKDRHLGRRTAPSAGAAMGKGMVGTTGMNRSHVAEAAHMVQKGGNTMTLRRWAAPAKKQGIVPPCSSAPQIHRVILVLRWRHSGAYFGPGEGLGFRYSGI